MGPLSMVMELFKQYERRDPAEVIGDTLPDPIPFASQRDFVREVLTREVDYRAIGTEYTADGAESEATLAYREHMNSQGSPTEAVAEGYVYRPGTELAPPMPRAA